MKKLFALLLALALVLSLAACGEKADAPAGEQAGQNNNEEASNNTENNDNTNNDAETDEGTGEGTGEEGDTAEGSPAQVYLAAFSAAVKAGDYADMEALGNKIVEADAVPLGLISMKMEPGWLNGFTAEVTGFSDCAVIAPMIGSIPFISYVFTLEENVAVDDFVSTLQSIADLRWNICTSADEMAYAVEDGVVCFVMAPASFEE